MDQAKKDVVDNHEALLADRAIGFRQLHDEIANDIIVMSGGSAK